MKVLGDKKIDWLRGFSLGFERDTLFGYNIYLEYSYTFRRVDDVITFTFENYQPPDPAPVRGSYYTLYLHNIDLGLRSDLIHYISYTLGPSIALVSRSFVTDHFPNTSVELDPAKSKLEDRLYSFCAGVNASLNLHIPVSSGSNYVLGICIHFGLMQEGEIWTITIKASCPVI
jgi:hypothetical protein